MTALRLLSQEAIQAAYLHKPSSIYPSTAVMAGCPKTDRNAVGIRTRPHLHTNYLIDPFCLTKTLRRPAPSRWNLSRCPSRGAVRHADLMQYAVPAGPTHAMDKANLTQSQSNEEHGVAKPILTQSGDTKHEGVEKLIYGNTRSNSLEKKMQKTLAQ